MDLLTISNQGPDILASNYWGSELDQAGKFYFSCNAGAIRMLVPQAETRALAEWRTAEYLILSRGPWPKLGVHDAIELLFEDHSDAPYAMHFTAASFDFLPGPPEPGQQWTFAAWLWGNGAPYKALELPIRWRKVERIPWRKRWA